MYAIQSLGEWAMYAIQSASGNSEAPRISPDLRWVRMPLVS
ncbi:MAG: hypothetical protein FD169_1791 [Bacillota bacterium]|nr:MAG: hypothetical protein FD169_1791 [Bacillota bacterium]